jgi:hypothetical protein
MVNIEYDSIGSCWKISLWVDNLDFNHPSKRMQGDPFVIMLRFWERDICKIYSQGMSITQVSVI